MSPKRHSKEEMRSEITRLVHRRLADREFAERLIANEETGERPIIVALREDSMARVLRQSTALGGTINLFVGVPAGIVGIGMACLTSEAAERRSSEDGVPMANINKDCTVGVFLAQLEIFGDEARILRFVDGGKSSSANGSARVVAFA